MNHLYAYLALFLASFVECNAANAGWRPGGAPGGVGIILGDRGRIREYAHQRSGVFLSRPDLWQAGVSLTLLFILSRVLPWIYRRWKKSSVLH